MGTWLLLAVTNHITQNIASIPFLWMVPLTLYLATFIICFDHERWYHRGVWVAPALALLGACAYGLQTDDVTLNVKIAVPVYAGGLFAWCLFCHGELARLKPAPRRLTTYYLMIAAGGAVGGLIVGLVAPRVLNASYELGIRPDDDGDPRRVVLRRVFFLVPVTALARRGLRLLLAPADGQRARQRARARAQLLRYARTEGHRAGQHRAASASSSTA